VACGRPQPSTVVFSGSPSFDNVRATFIREQESEENINYLRLRVGREDELRVVDSENQPGGFDMRRKMIRSISLTLSSILCLVAFQQAALAGPPLLCHPFDINNARSLPWSGSEWRGVDKNYNINRLVEDTLGLLTPETPVIVRMETLRRATVYAVWSLNDYKVGYSVKDASVATELLARLKSRIPAAGVKSDKRATALAMFDYGYLVETYKQAGDGSVKLAGGIDGYGMIVKASAQIGSDPAMEYAAALSCMGRKKEAGQDAYVAHLQKALAGAQEGSLLGRNILNYFRDRGKTIAELRASIAKN
jgi:hypothetical protein